MDGKIIQIPVDFTPRPYQEPLLDALDSGYKRAIMLAHRRSGKDITALNYTFKKMVEEVGVYYYIFPTYKQARKVIWDSMTNEGKKMIDYFWEPLVEKKNHSEMKIRLTNGSLFQLVGSDRYDDLMGTNPRGVVFSEYALQDPRAWEYIKPILRINGGWALFVSTPRGKNHFYELWGMAQQADNWYTQKVTIDDTGIIGQADIDEELAQGMSEEMIAQEYFCSFSQGIEGTYYGRLVDKVRKEGRIGNVLLDNSTSVNTYWDLGFGDSTAIIFCQRVGNEMHIIDYYENSGEGLAHYAKVLQDKGYTYGKHWAPHDVEAGHLSIGQSLRSYALDFGLKFHVVQKHSFDYGIECARVAFDNVWFDQKKCKRLIDCLENYHKNFNAKMNCYSNTCVHDQWSHGADAWRYLGIVNKLYSNYSTLTRDRIVSMREKHQGGDRLIPPKFPHEHEGSRRFYG